jgi:hypothetical protein
MFLLAIIEAAIAKGSKKKANIPYPAPSNPLMFTKPM